MIRLPPVGVGGGVFSSPHVVARAPRLGGSSWTPTGRLPPHALGSPREDPRESGPARGLLAEPADGEEDQQAPGSLAVRRTRALHQASWVRSPVLPVADSEMLSRDVAADRAAEPRISRPTGCDRNDEDIAGDLGHHEPMARWASWIEEWIVLPHVQDVIQAEVGVLEEVRCLVVGRPTVRGTHDDIAIQATTQPASA